MKTTAVLGQPSWEIASSTVRAWVTRRGGQMAPVAFRLGGREVEPYAVAPWAEEKPTAGLPPMLQVLRGDFFCAPFGGNGTPFRGEIHPPHGESANAPWMFRSLESAAGSHTLHLSMATTTRPGVVDKFVRVRDGHEAVYVRHVLTGMTGPMNPGHHPMLRFPGADGSGLVSTSPVLIARVAPLPIEDPAAGGYQSLEPGAMFTRLDRVPLRCGGMADLSRYPARRGFEDIVMLVHESRADFAWSAVVLPDEGYVWYALKDPRVLRSTIFWLSNGGRHYAPWNGRHTGVLGVEDVTAYFHYGLAESARPNPLSRAGYPTALKLSPRQPLTVNHIQGVAAVPRGCGRVKSIVPEAGGIRINAAGCAPIRVALDTGFLYQHTT